ncbi:beta-glucosidase BglX [Mucilaginibacter sp. HD30]
MSKPIFINFIKLAIGVSLIAVSYAGMAQSKSDNAMNTYINKLMSRMTLDEKIGQLNLPSVGFDITGPILSQDVEGKIRRGMVGGVFNTYTPQAVRKLQEMAVNQTRLKIPLLFGYDVIHGHKTIFPIPLGLSASWDLSLIERTARAAAEEASADGVNWVFSPMVDITRDPRWGRVSEGSGEDPWLGSQIARTMVHGYQGNDLAAYNTVLACVKHFALYGAAEAGRDYNVVDMSERKMLQDYLPPYRAAVDAGVATVMTSFNEINGVPATANEWLLNTLLRKTWGFKGLVSTDYTGIMELVQHGIGDADEVTRQALIAGNDMDMVSEFYLNNLKKLITTKKVNVSYIDRACRRVLEAKYKLGLFKDPYMYVNQTRATQQIMSGDKLQLAKEAALKSMVLLKNKRNILPLKRDAKIAFIGPMVKDQRNLIGNWSGAGDWHQAISLWDALHRQYPNNSFSYAKGCNVLDDQALINKLNPHDAQIVLDSQRPRQLLDEAVRVAKDADVAVVFLGEPFGMSGEAASRSNISLPDNQRELLRALKATGKPVILVLMNGRPLTLQWEDENLDAILETWFAGTKAGEAIADVLFGKYNPSGRLTFTFPRNVGQIPIYYSEKNTGRPFNEEQKYTSKYLDVPNTPLYPFGFGLSYTIFSYSPVQLNKNTLAPGNAVTATITVTNTGTVEGIETAQLYIRDVVGSVTRPLKELKGFQQVSLKPGESKTLRFPITVNDLRFYNIQNKYVYEPGDFEVMIGPNSAQLYSAGFRVLR